MIRRAKTPAELNDPAPRGSSSSPLRAAIHAAAETARARSDFDDRDALQRVGSILPEYEVLGEVHRGGQGVVYKAVQRATNRVVAIKVQHADVFARSDASRFTREVTQLASLRHPNIVTMYDSGVLDATCWFSMEFIDGVSIDDYCLLGSKSPRDIVRLFVPIVRAVHHAHARGIIHRDIKPANILVDVEGVPRILDFGLAKLTVPDSSTDALISSPGAIVGTLAYMSPQQAAGAPVDTRSDIFSLGAVLFELLTGERPIGADLTGEAYRHALITTPARSARALSIGRNREDRSVPVLDRDLDAILAVALRTRPEDRYQSADALARELERYLSGDALDARRDSRHYLLRQFVRRYRAPIAVAAGFALLLTASVIGLTIAWHAAESARHTAETGLRLAGHTRLGSVARDDGRLEQAIELFEQARILGESLPESDPLVDLMLNSAYQTLAEAYLTRQNTDLAEDFIDRAIALSQEHLKTDPGDQEWLRRLSIAQSGKAAVLLQLDRAGEALAVLLEADRNLEAAHGGEIADEDSSNLVSRFTTRARALLKLDRGDEAIEAFHRVEQIATRAKEQSESPGFQKLFDWTAAAINLCSGYTDTGKQRKAIHWLWESEYRLAQTGANPTSTYRHAMLDSLQKTLGDVRNRACDRFGFNINDREPGY